MSTVFGNIPWVLLSGAFFGVGCGYHFVEPGQSFFPKGTQNVAVVELENRTPEVQLGAWCSRSLQQQLQGGGRALVAPNEAEFVVRGVVLKTTDDPRAFALTPEGARAEAQVSVHVELAASTQGQERFRKRAVGLSRYTASGYALSVDAERRQALRLACADALSGLLEELAGVWIHETVSSTRQEGGSDGEEKERETQ